MLHLHTHTHVSSVAAVGNGSRTGELISVPRVCTFFFQEGLAGAQKGKGELPRVNYRGWISLQLWLQRQHPPVTSLNTVGRGYRPEAEDMWTGKEQSDSLGQWRNWGPRPQRVGSIRQQSIRKALSIETLALTLLSCTVLTKSLFWALFLVTKVGMIVPSQQ